MSNRERNDSNTDVYIEKCVSHGDRTASESSLPRRLICHSARTSAFSLRARVHLRSLPRRFATRALQDGEGDSRCLMVTEHVAALTAFGVGDVALSVPARSNSSRMPPRGRAVSEARCDARCADGAEHAVDARRREALGDRLGLWNATAKLGRPRSRVRTIRSTRCGRCRNSSSFACLCPRSCPCPGLGPETKSGRMQIMSSTPQPQVRHGRCTATCVGFYVIELQE